MIIPNDILPIVTTEQFEALKAVTEKLKDGWTLRLSPMLGGVRVLLIDPECNQRDWVMLCNFTSDAFRDYWKPEPKTLEFSIYYATGSSHCRGFERFSQMIAKPYDGVWRITLSYGEGFEVDLREGEALHLTRAQIDHSGDLSSREELFIPAYTVETRAKIVANSLRRFDYVRAVTGNPQEHRRCKE